MLKNEIKISSIFEDEFVLAFHDINPVAPVHVLIIPKKHINSMADMTDEDSRYLCALTNAARVIAAQLGIDKSGFRIVANTNDDGGQTVHHLHWHLLGGRRMMWPPG
jgi:histidine triad (HIT) family protein